MPQTVPEQTMALVLQVIQQTTGAQAGAILTQAGLGRLLTTPPDPTSMRPGGTQEELIALFGVIYQMLGEDLTRLFMRNYGEATVHAILHIPALPQLLAPGGNIPRDQQIPWFVQTVAPFLLSTWAPLIVTEDEQAGYLAYDVCYACYGIKGAKRPLCAAGDMIFGGLGREALGRRVRVAEVECIATGGAQCKYALYK